MKAWEDQEQERRVRISEPWMKRCTSEGRKEWDGRGLKRKMHAVMLAALTKGGIPCN